MAGALSDIRVIDLGHVLAAPTASMILADLGADVIRVEPPGGDDSRQFGPFIEGLKLGGYSFDRYKTKKKELSSLRLVLDKGLAKYKKEIAKSEVFAEAACLTRDLVNTPANFLTPATYANRARTLARKYGIRTRIYNPREIIKMKMGAIMGVAKGSDQPPRLITWFYNGGRKGDQPIVLEARA